MSPLVLPTHILTFSSWAIDEVGVDTIRSKGVWIDVYKTEEILVLFYWDTKVDD